jgi:hypothetical protein
MRKLLNYVAAAGLVVGFATAMTANVAGAATDTVTNCSGSASDPGSLPYVVQNAASNDTITFALSLSCDIITLDSTISISMDLTINGPGAGVLAISGNGGIGVFNLPDSTGDVSVSISGLTIEDGGSAGGGIVNRASILNIGACTISDNTGSFGGGIDNEGGTLSVSDSTLSGNFAYSYGGGIYNAGGTLIVTNSTLSGNSANHGGAIYNDAEGTLIVTNSTLSGNSATYQGGGIYNNSDSVATAAATIVANSGSGMDCVGSVTDGGYNLDDDGSCGFTSTSDLSATPPDLDPNGLQDNGGPTETIALEPWSPAIGEVMKASLCATADQPGLPRPTPCDIGAYQFVKLQSITFASSPPLTATVGGPEYQVSADANSGLPVVFTIDPSAVLTCTLSGTCIIDADQDGGDGYGSAPEVQQSVTVEQGTQTVAFTSAPPATVVDGGPDYLVTLTGGDSGNPIIVSIDPTSTLVCSVTNLVVKFIGSGTCTIEADQAGNANYSAAAEVEQSFAVGPEPQAITSANGATATAGSPFSFTVTTTGSQEPSLTKRGKLPKGLKFINYGNGTATISGSTTAKRTGAYHLTFKATFGSGRTKYVVIQAFILTVQSEVNASGRGFSRAAAAR